VDEPTVHVVDDDLAVRSALALLLRAEGLAVRAYADAASFLAGCDPSAPGCVVADLDMPGMSGLELQERLLERGSPLPVIILTGHGDVPAAVRALKRGAVDFVEKPYDPGALIATIREALERDRRRRASAAEAARVAARAAALTPREREVMERVAAGAASKVIAAELAISERTVELHRARMMRKMGARSLAELVRMVDLARHAGTN